MFIVKPSITPPIKLRQERHDYNNRHRCSLLPTGLVQPETQSPLPLRSKLTFSLGTTLMLQIIDNCIVGCLHSGGEGYFARSSELALVSPLGRIGGPQGLRSGGCVGRAVRPGSGCRSAERIWSRNRVGGFKRAAHLRGTETELASKRNRKDGFGDILF